jgi:hypothetical protein
MNLADGIQTLQTALLYSWRSSLVRRLLFMLIQFSGNALDLIFETGENDTSDTFIGISYMCVCVCACVCVHTYILTSAYLLVVGVEGYGYT